MERVNDSFTSPLEEKALKKIVPLIPSYISPDTLTLISVVSSFMGGIFYLFYPRFPFALVAVNFMLFLNWLADSTDGKVAIFRNLSRPDYGYYIDHLMDAFSVLFLLGGLTLSDATNTDSWLFAGILVIIAFMNAHLKTSVLHVFSISIGKFSPTDARIALVGINFFILFIGNSRFILLGKTLTLFDLVGWLFAGTIILLLTPDIINTARNLNKEK